MDSNKYIRKLDFEIEYDTGVKVSDVKLKVRTNNKETYNEFKYKSFKIYKYNEDITSVCEMGKYTELEDNYIMNKDEIYIFTIEEIEVINMEFTSFDEMGEGENENNVGVFINGERLDSLERYCYSSKDEKGTAFNYRFVLKKAEEDEEVEENTQIKEEIKEENIEETQTTEKEENNTTEIITNESNNINNDNNINIYVPIFLSIITILIIIIIILAKKLKKMKNTNTI